jgi:hypothetical protein
MTGFDPLRSFPRQHVDARVKRTSTPAAALLVHHWRLPRLKLALALCTIALAIAACATPHRLPSEAAGGVLGQLKAAQLTDAIVEEDFPRQLQAQLGAKDVAVSSAPGYVKTTLTRLSGLERGGENGRADIIIERWSLQGQPVVQVTFRPKAWPLSPRRVSEMLSDYLFYDDGTEVISDWFSPPPAGAYIEPVDFSAGFYCSSAGMERKALMGVGGFVFGMPLEIRMISQRIQDFDGSIPDLRGHVAVQPAAGWSLPPETPSPTYPDRARRLQKNGWVRLSCRSTAGSMRECAVEFEQPQGLGFANQALAWAQSSSLQPTTAAVPAGDTSRTPIDLIYSLRNANPPCPALLSWSPPRDQ